MAWKLKLLPFVENVGFDGSWPCWVTLEMAEGAGKEAPPREQPHSRPLGSSLWVWESGVGAQRRLLKLFLQRFHISKPRRSLSYQVAAWWQLSAVPETAQARRTKDTSDTGAFPRAPCPVPRSPVPLPRGEQGPRLIRLRDPACRWDGGFPGAEGGEGPHLPLWPL